MISRSSLLLLSSRTSLSSWISIRNYINRTYHSISINSSRILINHHHFHHYSYWPTLPNKNVINVLQPHHRTLSVSTNQLLLQQRSSTSNNTNNTNKWKEKLEERHKIVLYMLSAIGVLVVGLSYAAVPLYRIFCQSYSYGGTTSTHDPTSSQAKDLTTMKPIMSPSRPPLTIKFNADKSSSLQWSFAPRQSELQLYPGETALAFYTATNSTGRPIDGISTYNVIPYEVGAYFNKIQCFCFEEQRLNPGETVELPVFFYIDPEFANDPKMENVNTIMLSYTFFEAKEVPNLSVSGSSSFGPASFPVKP